MVTHNPQVECYADRVLFMQVGTSRFGAFISFGVFLWPLAAPGASGGREGSCTQGGRGWYVQDGMFVKQALNRVQTRMTAD